jgi:resuscitation-promoting factor RpfA
MTGYGGRKPGKPKKYSGGGDPGASKKYSGASTAHSKPAPTTSEPKPKKKTASGYSGGGDPGAPKKYSGGGDPGKPKKYSGGGKPAPAATAPTTSKKNIPSTGWNYQQKKPTTPAAPAAPAATAPTTGKKPSTGGKTLQAGRYTVKKGDNLWNISKKQFGTTSNASTAAATKSLYERNKGVVGKNPNLIKPNQILTTQKTTKPSGKVI